MLDQGPPSPGQNATDEEAPRHSGIIVALILFCAGIELVLTLSDFGVFATPRLRQLTYEYAGFWPGLLDNWKANFALQPYAMFLSYAFLHAGLLHLVINMVTLWSLGLAVIDRVGALGFAFIYLVAALGGASGYALLGSTLQPMVGASGALFGLAGALLAWHYVDRYTYQQGLVPIAQAFIVLVLLNLVLWWAMGGQLAWEAHLGGFVTGWVTALLADPRAIDQA